MLIVIPARLYSGRLAHKPLILIHDEPLIRHVVRQVLAMEIEGAEVVVATDDEEVRHAVGDLAQTYLTAPTLPNGTLRVHQVMRDHYKDYDDIVVNVQGDQLSLSKQAVLGSVRSVQNGFDIGTVMYAPRQYPKAMHDTNRVKVVVVRGQAIGFYRQAAWAPDHEMPRWWTVGVHIGVYAYTLPALDAWAGRSTYFLEDALSLEQVRPLQMGMTIGCGSVGEGPLTIDTQEDVAAAQGRRVYPLA